MGNALAAHGLPIDLIELRNQISALYALLVPRGAPASASLRAKDRAGVGLNLVELRDRIATLQTLLFALMRRQNIDPGEVVLASALQHVIAQAGGRMEGLSDKERARRIREAFERELTAAFPSEKG